MHHHSARIAALSAIFIALALAALSAADAQQQLSAKWSNTVSSSRYLHGTYTRLHNGSVLAVGGSVAPTAEEARSAEIYNPTTGVWRETSPMNYQRQFHEAHLLPDGRALVIGGYTPNVGPAPVYAGPPEVFDPATGKWSALNTTGVDLAARYGLFNAHPISALLPNGKVLLVNGAMSVTPLLLDPMTGVIDAGVAAPQLRGIFATNQASLTVLFDGKVLLRLSKDALIYDPEAGTWSETSLPRFNNIDLVGRGTSILPDGSLLALLETPSDSPPQSFFSGVLDPLLRQWRRFVPRESRGDASITLTDGNALALDYNGKASLYDSTARTWSAANPSDQIGVPALLADGRVLAGKQVYGVDFGSTTQPTSVNTSGPKRQTER